MRGAEVPRCKGFPVKIDGDGRGMGWWLQSPTKWALQFVSALALLMEKQSQVAHWFLTSDSCYWGSCQELSTIHHDLPLFWGRAATFDTQCVAVLLWKLHQSQGGKQKGCKFGGLGMNMRKMNWKLCTSQNITPPIYSSNPQLYSWFAVSEGFFFLVFVTYVLPVSTRWCDLSIQLTYAFGSQKEGTLKDTMFRCPFFWGHSTALQNVNFTTLQLNVWGDDAHLIIIKYVGVECFLKWCNDQMTAHFLGCHQFFWNSKVVFYLGA